MKKSNPNKWLKIKPECILIVQFKGLYVDIIALFNKGIYSFIFKKTVLSANK